MTPSENLTITQANPGEESRRVSRRWPRAILRIAGSIVALVILFRFLPLEEVWTTLRRLPPLLWLLVVVGYLSAHLIGASKWRLMVNLGGADLSFRQAVRCYSSGLFSTLFMPSVIGGDVVRAGLAIRTSRSKAGVIVGSFLDRVIDFLALGLLVAIGAALVPGALAPASRRIFLTVGAVIAVVAILLVAIVAWFPARKFSFRLRRGFVRLRRAAHAVRRQPQYVLSAICMALVVQGSLIWLTARVAAESHLQLPFRAWLFAWPLAKLSALVPLTQGGIGVREAALAALLIPFGARVARTVAVGLAWEGVIISGGLIAGLTAYVLGHFPAVAPPLRSTEAAGQSLPAPRR
ncbi:MAG TPA: lysylphosphatidylglycerol synthase transmembrane domain-containing protein [Candidatus Acidoferrales bacterium]|nr:lysylphosphatidylglycerol synthase transmembrane domain-containing protein [Candidatus Acidoferrales bacterium]